MMMWLEVSLRTCHSSLLNPDVLYTIVHIIFVKVERHGTIAIIDGRIISRHKCPPMTLGRGVAGYEAGSRPSKSHHSPNPHSASTISTHG